MKRMKLNWNHAVKSLMIIVMLIATQSIIQAQVFTRILSDDETIKDYIPWYFDEELETQVLPPVDVKAVLEKDAKENYPLYRYGISVPLMLTENDGYYYKHGNYTVWKTRISSANAKSLNFEFTNLNLPRGSKMFIHGMKKKMIHGPVVSKNVHEGIYTSDVVYGDYAVIEVFLSNDVVNDFSITIHTAIHGINRGQEKAFNDSQDCNVNVVCEEDENGENQWENEINAVCLILISGGAGICTGTLINNECFDMTPYLLTAEHCFAGGNPNTWVYRFNYETTECDRNIAIEPTVWLSFSGAQTRASWDLQNGTDFALLELNEPVIGHPGLGFAGWNRSATPLTNRVVSIHHPADDVKKISFNNDGIDDLGIYWNIGQWDIGLVEPGSSGCALFDESQLIIGQLYGGVGNIGCHNGGGLVDNTKFGKLDASWAGNGTNATRLSNWLGGTNNPSTVGGLAVPFIDGTDLLCPSVTESYTLENSLQGDAITWSVSPSSLFGSATNGLGVTANLWALNNSSQGVAILTYTLSRPICEGSVHTITKEIWVGTLTPTVNKWCFDEEVIILEITNPQPNVNYQWQVISQHDVESFTGTSIDVDIWDTPAQYVLTATNKCGTVTVSGSIDKSDCVPKGKKLVIYPNPVKEVLQIKIPIKDKSKSITSVKSIRLFDNRMTLSYEKQITSNSFSLSTIGLPTGVYFLQVNDGQQIFAEKIIIQHE